jgi:hypothetical protein
MKWPTVVNERSNFERSELGRVIIGTYGKDYVLNDEGEEVKVQEMKPRIVRGRGRPLKDDNGTGSVFEFSEDLKNIQTIWS